MEALRWYSRCFRFFFGFIAFSFRLIVPQSWTSSCALSLCAALSHSWYQDRKCTLIKIIEDGHRPGRDERGKKSKKFLTFDESNCFYRAGSGLMNLPRPSDPSLRRAQLKVSSLNTPFSSTLFRAYCNIAAFPKKGETSFLNYLDQPESGR